MENKIGLNVLCSALVLLVFTYIPKAGAVDSFYNFNSKILDIPGLQIDNSVFNAQLKFENDGCFSLLSIVPAFAGFTGASYIPETQTATLQAVAVGQQRFQATIQFVNNCFRLTHVAEIAGTQVQELRYQDAEVTGQVISGDFNGDSVLDLSMTIRTLPGHVSGSNQDMFRVAYGDMNGQYTETQDIFRVGSSDSTKRGHQLIAGKFDQDMIDDFAISTGQIFQVFTGSSVTAPQSLFNSTGVSGAPLYSADIDGNGFDDFISIVFGGSIRSMFNLYRYTGSGFSDVEFIGNIDDVDLKTMGVGTPLNFTLGLFNEDNFQDILALVLTGSGNNSHLALALFSGNGDGSFNNPSQIKLLSDDLFLGEFAFEDVSKEIAFGDFDGNGSNDIAITSTTSFVQTLLNNGSGVFTEAQRVQVGNKPIHVRVADFDNDQVNDLLSINANSKTVQISFGLGNGEFADAIGSSGQVITFQLAGDVDFRDVDIADLDSDGFLDIIVGEDGTNPRDSGRGSLQIISSPGR